MKFLDKYKVKTLGGLNNRNFLLNYFGNFYVLRIPSKENENNFKVEHTALKLLSTTNLIPPIIYHNKDSGLLLSKYIKDTNFSFNFFKENSTLKILANTLNEFHNISIPDIPIFNPFYEIDKNILSLKKQDYKFNHNLSSYLDRKSFIFEKYKTSSTLKLCHNDLNTSNILFTNNSIFLIDFEFIGLNDPFFDLATISWFLNSNERNILLSEYLGRKPTDYEKTKLLDYLYIVKLWNATWSLKKSLDNKDSIYDYEMGANLILDNLN
ncbi:MAG: phosphotransferase [Clostridium sp.]